MPPPAPPAPLLGPLVPPPSPHGPGPASEARGAVGAESHEHAEGPKYVFGIGGAFALDLGESHFNPGGTAFFEFEAIEHWLAIEAGVTYVKTADGSELASAILFKKPFEIGKHVELLVGLGPEAVQTVGSTPSTAYFGIEGILNFMFWPSERFGIFLTPAYDLVFKPRTTDRFGPTVSYGTTVGPMVSWH